jgi:hypothetical protein
MIMQTVNLRVGVPDMGDIRGVPGITETKGPPCRLDCEDIVSKRLGSPYRSGRSPHWVKVKNPKAPAVTREAEEDWGR